MTPNSHHQNCCNECQYTFFWQPGFCCDIRSDLVKQFAAENAESLQALEHIWDNTISGSKDELVSATAMKDLYHDFLRRQKGLVSEGFLLEEMAAVTESLTLNQKAKATQSVGVSV